MQRCVSHIAIGALLECHTTARLTASLLSRQTDVNHQKSASMIQL